MTKILTKKEILALPEDERQLYGILDSILQCKKNIENNIIDLGWNLCLAKDLVPYGEWENWLADNVDFSVRTAQKYMKVADQYYDLREIEPFNSLNKSQLVALLDVKKDDRKDFANNTHNIDGVEKTIQEMTIRELKEVIKNEKKAKKKSKEIRNEYVDVSETKSDDKVIDVNFKESQDNKDKLKDLILEQQKIEKELELKRQQVIDVKKELILENNLDLDIVFEEEVAGDFLIDVYFYMYVIGYDTKRFIGKHNSYEFETLELGDESGYIYSSLRRNKDLLQEEKDFILKKCYEMKDYVISRDKILREERRKENDQKMYEDILGKINKNQQQEPQGNKDLKKEFIIAGYKALAKKYHPDRNQGNAEAEDKFKAVGIFKEILLQQNLLN